MNALDEYLGGEYRDSKQMVEELNHLVEEVFWTLILPASPHYFHYFVSKEQKQYCWPYKIMRDMEPEKKYSVSTNAMILFALAKYQKSIGENINEVTCSEYIKDILNPEAFKNISLSAAVENLFSKADSEGVEFLSELVCGHETYKNAKKKCFSLWPIKIAPKMLDEYVLTISMTYGVNDPLSLFWMASLCQKESGKEEGVNGEKFSTKLKEVLESISQADVITRTEGDCKGTTIEGGSEVDLHNNAFVFLVIRKLFDILGNIFQKNNIVKEFIESKSKKIHSALEGKLHRHLSYSDIPDSRFDPAELVFCLEGLLVRRTQEPLEGVVRRVFEVLLKMQQQSSVFWKPTTPIYATKTGQVLLPLGIEVANSLLRICEILDQDSQETQYFNKCLPLFGRYVDWLKAQQICVRFKLDKEIRLIGWASEHTASEDRIHTWQTSQIFIFLDKYRNLLNRSIASEALKRSGIKLLPPRFRRYQEYPCEMMDWTCNGTKGIIDIDPISSSWTEKISEIITDEYLCPRLCRLKPKCNCDRQLKAIENPGCSFLLYGPPGTGKTTIVKKIAAALNWRFLSITPSDFLAGGAAEVEQRAKAIFTMLEEQEELVVLFDEIDHLLLDRESEEYSKLTGIFQFITPGMLPKLHDLRDKGKIIFVVATNYAERIDGAIKRDGRLDKQLLLLPPDKSGRKRIIKEVLEKRSLEIDEGFETSLEKIAKCSCLLTWKDLDAISKNLDGVSVKEKLDCFAKKAEEKERIINPSYYLNRFFSGNTGENGGRKLKEIGKSPWKEFLSLIVIECGYEEILDKHKKDFENLLKDEVLYTHCFKVKRTTEKGVGFFSARQELLVYPDYNDIKVLVIKAIDKCITK